MVCHYHANSTPTLSPILFDSVPAHATPERTSCAALKALVRHYTPQLGLWPPAPSSRTGFGHTRPEDERAVSVTRLNCHSHSDLKEAWRYRNGVNAEYNHACAPKFAVVIHIEQSGRMLA